MVQIRFFGCQGRCASFTDRLEAFRARICCKQLTHDVVVRSATYLFRRYVVVGRANLMKKGKMPVLTRNSKFQKTIKSSDWNFVESAKLLCAKYTQQDSN